MGTAIDTFFYFLAFFALVGSASVVFLGLPIFTFWIASSVSSGYTASLDKGFIPALCIRRSTVLGINFNSFAISEIVKPFISSLSAFLKSIYKCLKNQTLIRNICIVKNAEKIHKKSMFFIQTLLHKCLNYATIKSWSVSVP